MAPPQAKVFADDISLDFTTSVPYVVYYSNSVIDTTGTGNNNGHLDPGETVDLVTCLKNYGVSATGVQGLLLTDDSYITIHDSISDFGDIASGDTANNVADPFSVESATNTPTGHTADFTLIANSTGGYSDTSHFSLCIGKYNYLVWDPSPDQSSGPIIDATLQSLGYSGNYMQILPVTELDSYISVFVSCGIFSNNYIIQDGSAEANALVNFLNNGGCMYLEGGDVWYYDPLYAGGYNFGPLFGISPTADGSSDLATIQGQSGTFTDGMSFVYSGENSWIDHISATGTGFLIFKNSGPVYDCGVANNAGGYKTVGTSFEFGGLTDGSPPSTKEAFADSIMHFFAITGVEEKPVSGSEKPEIYKLSQNYPNPFSTVTIIRYAIPKSSRVRVSLYDVSGRCVKRLVNEKQNQGFYTVRLDGKALKTGIYFIRLQSGNTSLSRKCIIVR